MHVTMIIGRVGADPKPLGSTGCSFSIATDDWNGSTKQRETTWSRLVCFGKNAETAIKYVTKGRLIAVRCRYQVREYESSGEKRVDHSFIVDHLELLPDGSKREQQQTTQDEEVLWS